MIRRAPIARRSRPRRQRKGSVPALRRKLWAAFAAYVKARDGNVCFSCGRGGLEGSGWHAGHMFPANGNSLIRFEPKNVHSQCFHCNVNLGGNGAAYAVMFLAVYGDAELRRLARMAGGIKRWTAPEMREMVEALKRGGADFETLHAERYGLA